MSNVHVSPSTLDFVDVPPAAAPESGDGPGQQGQQGQQGTKTTIPLHSWTGAGNAIEKVLYVGLAAGFIFLIYGLSTLFH